MGPGRLTGMNDGPPPHRVARRCRFNGARSIDRDERPVGLRERIKRRRASMGPGRLTGMNGSSIGSTAGSHPTRFNGARSIDRDERVVTEGRWVIRS